jgi:hypothetical protein
MRAAFSFVMLMAISVAAGAQAPKRSTADELSALEHRWVEAIVKADVAKLEKMLASTYVDTDEDGGRATKTEVLAVLRSGDLRFQSIVLSGLQVHEYGSAAVVTGTAAQRGAYKAQPVAAKVVFTDTFVRTQAGWMVVASQRTAVH